jgi:hypothetical protein
MDLFKAFPLLFWKQVTQQFKEKPPRFFLVNEFVGRMLLKLKILQSVLFFKIPRIICNFLSHDTLANVPVGYHEKTH